MKNKDILNAIGDLSDDLVVDAAPGNVGKKSRWPAWAAAAACVCLIAAGGMMLNGRGLPDPSIDPVEPTATAPAVPTDSGGVDTPPAVAEVPTSDQYGSLSELLTYLGEHDDHSRQDNKGGGAGGDLKTGQTAVAAGGCAYYLDWSDGCTFLRAASLAGGEPTFNAELDGKGLFLWGDRLAVVGQNLSELSLEDPGWAWVKLYRLTDPAKPELEREFALLGGLSACWQDGDSLWLAAEDGTCACGYSRLSDPAGYLPQLRQDGREVVWEETETAVLGAPDRVHYAAVIHIDLSTGEVAGKRAFYGDIERIFGGEDGFALITEGSSETVFVRPAVYSFNEELVCDGRMETAALLGLTHSVPLEEDGALPDGEYPHLVSVSRKGETLRAVGYVARKSGEAHSTALLAVSLNLTAGTAANTVLDVERFSRIGDLIWEEGQAVLCVTTFNGGLEKEDAVYLARFDGAAPAITATGLTGASVDGVDGMYGYGSPLGWLDTLIPLGGGRYLRYNGTPNGLDFYDLSGDAPTVRFRSGDVLGGGGRLEFRWVVYNADTVGVLAVWPDENGKYRDVTCTWNMYEVGESGLTQLSRTPCTEAGTVFEYGGRHYMVGADGAVVELT